MVTKQEISPHRALAAATHRQTVQLAVPHDSEGLKSYFEKDAAGNIIIKNDQLKNLIDKRAMGATKRGEAEALTISVGIDW